MVASIFFSMSGSITALTVMKSTTAIVVMMMMHLSVAAAAASNANTGDFQCPPGLFSFGTSLSDTGSYPFAFPYVSRHERLPYGETFFGRNALRFADGRIIVDFFDLAFGYPLLSSYFQSVGPNFLRGVSFAFNSATAIPEALEVPFYLDFQVAQFVKFKQSTIAANQLKELSFLTEHLLPSESTFDKGLYILLGFGRNDLTHGYQNRGLTPETAVSILIPNIVNSIVRGIQTLYKAGARSFLVVNTSPQGCSPQYLTTMSSATKADYDEFGCLAVYNYVNQVLNNATLVAIQALRKTLNNSSILYFDFYAAYKAVFQNPQMFGFAPVKTLVACCGIGGEYNYNDDVLCASTGVVDNVNVTAKSCSNPQEYIYWDGIHFTDSFNRVIAQFLLTGKFLDPPVDMKTMCDLDFSQFLNSSFEKAYPNGVLITSSLSSQVS